jgi:DNA polymerase-1
VSLNAVTDRPYTTLLVDADIVAFKFASSNQESHEWGNGVKTVTVTPLEKVAAEVDLWLATMKETLKADELIICLSCPHEENFRLGVLPSYKGNRDYDNRPVLLGAIKDHMADNYRTYARPSLEADDVMGILSTHPTLIPGKKIIVSEDKDMKTIPGWLYNPAKDFKPRLVTEAEAERYHLYQALIGDSTDHYKGCPGVGPVAAEDFLDRNYLLVPHEHEFKSGPRKGTFETRYTKELDCPDTWAGIVSLYAKAGLTEEDALVQARCARILRACDYNFKERCVLPWNPPAVS